MIFPYPCASVHTEAGDANRAGVLHGLRVVWVAGVGTDLVVGK